jgi:hypothetical protein
VGRTPSSAPDPPVRLFVRDKADWGVGCGPGGPPHIDPLVSNFFHLN